MSRAYGAEDVPHRATAAGGTVVHTQLHPSPLPRSIGVLARSACHAAVLAETVCDGIATLPRVATKRLEIEHPTGEFTVELTLGEGESGRPGVKRAALLRTRAGSSTGVHCPAFRLGRQG